MLKGPLSQSHRHKIDNFIRKMGKQSPDELAKQLPGEKRSHCHGDQFKVRAYAPSEFEELRKRDNLTPEEAKASRLRPDLSSEKDIIENLNEDGTWSRRVQLEGDRNEGLIVDETIFKKGSSTLQEIKATAHTEETIEIFSQRVDSNGGTVSGHYLNVDKRDPNKSFSISLDEEWLLGEKKHTTVSAGNLNELASTRRQAEQTLQSVEKMAAKVSKLGPGKQRAEVADKKVPVTLLDLSETWDTKFKGGLGSGVTASAKVLSKAFGARDRVSGTTEFANSELGSTNLKVSGKDGAEKGDYYFQESSDGTKIYSAPTKSGLQSVVKEDKNGEILVATTDQKLSEFLAKDQWAVTSL